MSLTRRTLVSRRIRGARGPDPALGSRGSRSQCRTSGSRAHAPQLAADPRAGPPVLPAHRGPAARADSSLRRRRPATEATHGWLAGGGVGDASACAANPRARCPGSLSGDPCAQLILLTPIAGMKSEMNKYHAFVQSIKSLDERKDVKGKDTFSLPEWLGLCNYGDRIDCKKRKR